MRQMHQKSQRIWIVRKERRIAEMVDRAGKGFRKLLVWQKAHQLVLQVYKLTENFPKHEMFGLTSQLRRAIVSVPANIAEV